jgi:nitroimidazol reductase NimA-like FMN-containing flavoprotein (pyridoxamine 5'-phosphate oxidase superfamily)
MNKLRRKDRAIESSEAIEILMKGEYGILSTVGDNEQPYGVPLSYVYKGNSIYIHCARVGHKIDNIRNNPKVSFCVVGNTTVLPSEFATEYESSIIFGTAAEIQGAERYNALIWIVEKYSPDYLEEGKHKIKQQDNATKVVKITIDQISGKARK